MLLLWLFNWDYQSVSPNTKLNLISWWICFSVIKRTSTKRNDTCFYKDSIHSMVHAKWAAIMLYKAQRMNVNIRKYHILNLYLNLVYTCAKVVCVYRGSYVLRNLRDVMNICDHVTRLQMTHWINELTKFLLHLRDRRWLCTPQATSDISRVDGLSIGSCEKA